MYTLQGWVTEMAGYVKSLDPNHMVEIGLEGFYGESKPGRIQFNPGNYTVGTDFVSNNLVPAVDFATIHSYPDQWYYQPKQNFSNFDMHLGWFDGRSQAARGEQRGAGGVHEAVDGGAHGGRGGGAEAAAGCGVRLVGPLQRIHGAGAGLVLPDGV